MTRSSTRIGSSKSRPAGVTDGSARFCFGEEQLTEVASLQGRDRVDEVVGDQSKPDPSVHSDEASVAASVEAGSTFDDADAGLTIRCAISGRCGTNASSACAGARGSWWRDWELATGTNR
jgi:hypothetical protein